MFSHQQISRWLSFSLDPITLEDWLANREIFGKSESVSPEEKQLETAFQIETVRLGNGGDRKLLPLEVIVNALDLKGVIDENDYLLIAPPATSSLEVNLDKKIKIPPADFLVIPVDREKSIKLSARGKTSYNWSGAGKIKIIIDTRGRPIKFLDGRKQQDLIAKIKQQLA